MKPILFSTRKIIVFFLALFVFSCKNPNHQSKVAVSQSENESEAEEQDGIALAQQMEFEQTKDPRLGIVPKDRLMRALEDLRIAKENGQVAELTSALSWTERGPNSDIIGPSNGNGRITAGQVTAGRIRTIWVDLTDVTNQTIWVGGVDGGIWKTGNLSTDPTAWSLVSDVTGSIAISSITQSPVNPNHMYFGTGEKTANADAVRGGGVWKSTDHGVNWALLGSTTNFWNVSKVVCDPVDVNIVYVATMGPNNNGIQRSIDGGATWVNITPTGLNTAVTEMELSSTGRLHIVCGYAGGFFNGNPSGYRYTDNPSFVTTADWTSPAVPFTSTIFNVDLATAGATLYALPANGAYNTPIVWKSIDGGANWAVTAGSPAGSVSSGQAWYNIAIAVDPTNTNNVMVAGLNSFISTNGGTTWAINSGWLTGQHPSQYIHADHQILVWNNNQVLDGGDGGIFYSGDDGVTWSDRNVGLRLKQFYACAIHPTLTNYFLAGAQDNGCHQQSGAGLSSSTEFMGGDGCFVHIDEDQPQFQWGAYVFNSYHRSINSGANWTFGVINDQSNGSFVNPTDYDDMNNIMYCTKNGNEYNRWTNPQSGNTISAVTMTALGGGRTSCIKVSPYTTNRVFFGSGNVSGAGGGKILKADNANAVPTVTNITGSGMTANSNVSCIAVGTDDNNLLATFSNYGISHVWFSSIGGGAAGWTDISGTLPDIPVRWAMFNPEDNDKAIIATELGIYETTDINAGATVWVKNTSFPTVKTNMLQYRFSDNTILAATHGRGLWTSQYVPTNAYVRFASSYSYSPVRAEATATTVGCRRYTDYTLNMHIDRAPVGAAFAILSIAGGSTASVGSDFDFTTNGDFNTPSTALVFPDGGTADQPITIRVYDDAEIDAVSEFFTFNYIIGGVTDAIPAPSSSSYTFYISENDVVPASGTNPIASVLGTSVTEHLPNNGTYYFYNGLNIICRLASVSADLGCVNANIHAAGPIWQNFLGGQRSQKVFSVSPTTNPGATYTIGLYFTSAELGGKTPNTLRVAKSTAATIAGANQSNSTWVTTPAPVAYGTGWVYTVTFTGFSLFFLIDPSSTLPLTLLDFNGQLNNKQITLNWSTSMEFNTKHFEIEKSSNGSSFYNIGIVPAAGNSSSPRHYSRVDKQVNEFNFYRLKMVDIDGKYTYSTIILIKDPYAQQYVKVLNNPFDSYVDLNFARIPKQKIEIRLINSAGALVLHREFGPADRIRLDVSGMAISRGVYFLQSWVDGKEYVNRLLKQ